VLKDLYHFQPQLIVRIPAQPFEVDITEASLRASLHDARFMESIYLASPALYEECGKWRRGELTDARKIARLRSTLARYYVRSRSRCTPFGLFAGCGLAGWGATSQLAPTPARNARHTRLDMHYLCALAQRLAAHPAIRPHLRYWPNTSLYELGEELRYVEHHYAAGRRVHQLNAAAANPYLHEVLAAARPGATYPALVALLRAAESEPGEAEAFIDELIEGQLLVHELEPTVTGAEFFDHLLAVLARLATAAPSPAVAAVLSQLEEVRQQLAALDAQPANEAAAYERLVATLAPLGVLPEPGKLFQTDTVPDLGPTPTLAQAWQPELLAALEALTYLAPPPTNARLAAFRDRFVARYETQEVPLLEALDNESGISYTSYGKSTFAPLVHDLVLAPAPAPAAAPALTPVQQLLHDKLRQAERTQQYCLDMALAELRQAAGPTAEPLPPSLAILFRVLDAERLVVESAGGSSAVNLLGRFAHGAPGIAQLIGQVTQAEQAHNPAVAFAEICHLPASRTGNLLQRPSFRSLEIPYLAQSTRPAAGQVLAADLLLSVRQGQLVLHARTTGQRIIPRLSTAHNFTHEALPVYQFLCDLQTQGLHAHLGFSWAAAGAAPARFSPRLTCGRAVLAVAAWHLAAADLAPLLSAATADFAAQWAGFRQQWQLPRFFTLADADNELLVDADNPTLVAAWLDTIRQRPEVQLKEFLFDPAASPVRDAAGRPYVQQALALLVRQGPCYPALAPPPAPAAPVQREFSLGSEWLYYKLYCGQKVANQVLLGVVQPLTQELLAQELIDNWFFIRYADPDNHLRLRLHLPHPAQVGAVVQLVASYLQPYQRNTAVWKVQTDTYRRELERYGAQAIGLAEQLFGYQSAAFMARLAAEPAAEDEWLWGLAAMAELLDAFDYSLGQRLALLHQLRASFGREFGLDKPLKLQLDAKYRQARPAIEQALRPAATAPPAPLRHLASQVLALAAQGRLAVPLDHLLGAYLHMLLNRVLPAEARLHELVLYDFLHRHYQSQQAVQRAG
jgi:thiopeptide-type bacteriocin biosynthesis protein